ncbi:MAG: tetratricopeptide repeat protein [Cypionkella sp.]|nr:tetratricopeptide repeat protein [Cypionkella sp.]
MRQAMEIDRKALGEDHPDYATRLNNLASLLRATGRLAQAVPLFEQAAAILTAALGVDHPNTKLVTQSLAIARAELAAQDTPTSKS